MAILKHGSKACAHRLGEQETNSPDTLDKTLEDVLETIGKTLFDATGALLPGAPLVGGPDVYFWPGYVRASHREKGRRLTLSVPHAAEQRPIACGVGCCGADGMGAPYRESEAALRFDLVLNPKYEDKIRQKNREIGIFYPGGTHPWIMQSSSPPQLIEESSSHRAHLGVLAVDVGNAARKPQIRMDDGILSIRLKKGRCDQWGSTIEEFLNDDEHLAPNVVPTTAILAGSELPAGIKFNSRYRWPHSPQSITVSGKYRQDDLGRLANWVQFVRKSLYNIWIASCFDCGCLTLSTPWLCEFLTALQSADEFAIPTLADRIRNRLQRGTNQQGLVRHEYRFWYTIAVEGGIKEELGSAMILSTHGFPPEHLKHIKRMLAEIYLQMRHVELEIEASQQPKRGSIERGIVQPRASELDAVEWNAIRATARELLVQIGTAHLEGRDDFVWIHHAKNGGNEDPVFTNAATLVYESLAEKVTCTRQFPTDAWDLRADGAPSSMLVPAWERPPRRAIVQFDHYARDLSTALMLIHAHTPKVVGTQPIHVHMYFKTSIAQRLTHDYLWFNVSQVGRGLIALLQGFVGIAGDHICPQTAQPVKKWGVSYTEAGVDWIVCERVEESFMGIEITVAQYLKGRVSFSADDTFDAVGEILPFPDSAQVTERMKRIIEAYKLFERAGAVVSRTGTGALQIRIAAHLVDDHKTFWEVTCP